MKSITIKNESGFGLFDESETEEGFTISCSDDEKKASIYDLSKGGRAKLIPKEGFKNLWNKLMEVNFQKVLLENELYQGFDGTNSVVEISVGLQSLKLSLWCPNADLYKENNFSESMKLLDVVHELMDFAASHNVAVGFEF